MTARTLRRIGFGGLWLAAMAAVAIATYSALSSGKHTKASKTVTAPSATTPIFKLPGSVYLAHKGGLYRMQGGSFTELQAPGNWSQPSLSPDGRKIAAVRRNGVNFSDMYLLDATTGQVTNALTGNGASPVEYNRWAFYPRFSPDGQSIFYSSDAPKDYTYRVDFSIWQVPLGQPASKATRWTVPNDYTGGDVSPLPVKQGLLYVKYDVNADGKSYSQVFLTTGLRDSGHALTRPEDSCGQPAISPDGTRLAMICSPDPRTSRLVIAPYDGGAVGALQTVVDGSLVAAPAWSPDGQSLLYMAPPARAGLGNFELWYVEAAQPAPAPATAEPASPSTTRPTASPTAPQGPRQVTNNLDFDALSPPMWMS